MSSENKPSIFTSRDLFPRRPIGLPGASASNRALRPKSPLRRQSTPEVRERNRTQPIAEEVTPVHPAPESSNASSILQHNSIRNSEDSQGSSWSRLNDSKEKRSASPGSFPKGRSVSASHLLVTTPPSEHPPRAITPGSTGDFRKRHIRPNEEAGPTSEPSKKRQKLSVKPRSRHRLSGFPTAGGGTPPELQPPSPLFFSNSPRQRPTLPPRFSSSEAGARMLSKARMEDSHMKTVSLARGTATTPLGHTSVPQQPSHGSRTSSERRILAQSSSPEPTGRDAGGILSSIPSYELLELDDRPTFVVDLATRDNYGAGSLELAFANTSLRSQPGLEALVAGRSPTDSSPSPGTFLQFKAWLMSGTVNGQSLDASLPNFIFASMSWHCSTLRKRLRVIRGTFLATPRNGTSHELRTSIPPASNSPRPLEPDESAPVRYQEPGDYFGTAASDPVDEPASLSNGAVPSIERLPSVSAVPKTSKSATPGDANGNTVQPDPDLSGSSEGVHSESQNPPSSMSMLASPMITSPINSPQNASLNQLTRTTPCFDWTRLPVSDAMPPHIRFARSVDWGATALGPIEDWGSDLRQMCNLIMASPHPAAMYWGPDLIAIYNEAYVLLAGQKHPQLMGQSYCEAWSEIWNDVKDVFDSAQTTGEATMKDDDCLFMRRNEYLEETYFSWSIIPMVGNHGSVMGLYNPAFEKTRRKIAERRMLTLREVGERTATARDLKGFWNQVLSSFEFNEYDSPFLLLYSVSEDSDSDSSSINSNSVISARQCFLEGKLGVPDEHPAATEQIDLKSGIEGFGPVFREIMRTDKPVLLEVGTRDLPASLVDGLTWRGFGDSVRSVVVCPIHPTTGESILGFLVLGVNPRRPYDDDYSLFVQLLSRQLATSLASVVLFEEEIRRGQRAANLAALDRIELSEKLALRTKEAQDSETRFTRMAEFSPVGMVIAGCDGKITFANDTWYDISRVPRNRSLADTWMDFVNLEDLDLVQRLWRDLTGGKKLIGAEFRFMTQWEDRNGNRGETWVLLSGYPEKDEEGRVKSVFACFTNISQQKWAEGLQKRKMEEAVEMKRQQENFIDITSHEMRNPLSAILQCSDEITSSLTNFKQSEELGMSEELLNSCLDAAQIISLCSQHQKRIVDDILTLSKLDSQLLLVTPVDAQPLTVVQRALKMHESELQASDIHMNFIVDQSYRDLDLDWVRLDPSRVLQVLINLTTNAIKFTSSESNRTISVTISAAKHKPNGGKDAPVKYFPARRQACDASDEKEWGDGEKLYIHFAVRDTGRGLSAEEKKMLFMRFSQASPRTHVQYGGSGLGLFISRELTELQGGQIGVESEAGKGSTFAFYVIARRSSAPSDADSLATIRRTTSLDSRRDSSPAVSTAGFSQSGAKPVATPANSTAGVVKTIKRVLIVEDNLVNQKVLSKQLKNVGTEVHLANHGGEALDRLRQSTYWVDGSSQSVQNKLQLGVVLMDQEMPVMDGLTCTRKIRELEQEGKLADHVPIIAVTANARAEQVQTALDAGMDDVVSKPFRIPDLIPKIEELMAKYPAPAF